MPKVEWTENLNLGIKDVDEQHRAFLDIVNELLAAVQEKKAHHIQGEIIDKLIGYAFYHFTKEERYLDQSKYPGTAEHKKQHEAYVDKLMKFKNDLDKEKLTLNIEMINFMNSWWINHIKVSDKKYLPYVKEHVH